MSRLKNPTLRRRTKELSECAEDARECQLLGYELKDLGSLLVKMAIHMEDLQRKVDSQAEYIKTLNEDRKTENCSEKPNNCTDCNTCRFEDCKPSEAPCAYCMVEDLMWEPKTEPQNYCDDCLYNDVCDSKEFFYACTSKATKKPKDEPQNKYPTEWCEDCNLWREDNCMGVAQCKANMEAVMKIYEASKDKPQTERRSE